MQLKLKKFEVDAGRPIIFLNHKDAHEMDIHVGDRVEAKLSGKNIIGRVDILDNYLKSGEVALSEEIIEYLQAKTGGKVDITLVSKPNNLNLITKKMNGGILSKEEIYAIITDIVNNALTEAEIAEFIVAVYKNGMNVKETVYLTEAMCKTGTVLKWASKIVTDKHCIGGIPGNRTTPLVVSICAAAGVIMPKTSSRAITSAAGTADSVETVTKVDFPAQELQRIVKKTGACLAWGGSLGMAPADDKLIKIERILKIDPDSQLIASILSKKLAAGSTHVLIDIPYGIGAKVSKERAEELKRKFMEVGKHFGLKMQIVLTDGSQPIGNGIGPVLEMIDVLKILRREQGPQDLEVKVIMLSGRILEMVGKAKKGQGEKMARQILESGEAYQKFQEIINAQGRNPDPLKPAKYSKTVHADKDGKVRHLDSRLINMAAVIAGCPLDKGSGIYLYKHVGDKVLRGDEIMKVYAESKGKLKETIEFIKTSKPIVIYR